MAPQQLFAFFGATGGCTLAALVGFLKAGHQCRALARTPQRLLDSLAKEGVSGTAIQNLEIVAGNVLDQEAVAKTLRLEDGTLVPKIISGLGAAPSFEKNRFWPEIDQPTICTDGLNTIIATIKTLPYAEVPKITVISTTGIDTHRDLPLLIAPLYRSLLKVPHEDKKKMEAAVINATRDGVIGGYVIVRAAWLTNGELKEAKVKVGVTEFGKKGEVLGRPTKAIGYRIARKAVGNWIFKNLVEGAEGSWGVSGGGKKVTLTY